MTSKTRFVPATHPVKPGTHVRWSSKLSKKLEAGIVNHREGDHTYVVLVTSLDFSPRFIHEDSLLVMEET